MAMHKGLRSFLSGEHACFTVEELIYANNQQTGGWQFLFRGFLDRAWVSHEDHMDTPNQVILWNWCKDIIQCCIKYHYDCWCTYVTWHHGNTNKEKNCVQHDILDAKISQILSSVPLVLQRDKWLFEKEDSGHHQESITTKCAWINLVNNASSQYRQHQAKQETIL